MAAEEKKVVAIEEEKEITFVKVKDNYGNEFTLEFTPRVVKAMERRGFKIDMDYPYSCAEDLFAGAFQANYGGKITTEKINKIWAIQTHKDELLALLVKLYMNPFKELMAEPEGAKDENPTWVTG